MPEPRRPLRVTLRDDDVLFFQHIPKTAGSSLIALLDSQFAPQEVFPLHSASSPEMFERFSGQMRRGYRLVRGHFNFGRGDNGVYRFIAQNPLRIVMLRDPVDRTISAFRYTVREPENPLHEEVTERGLTLLDYVTDPRYRHRVQERQTRMIAGVVPGNTRDRSAPAALSDEALLALAKQKLEACAFVGLTERFAESMHLLAYTFGWEPPAEMPVRKAAPKRSSRDQEDAEVVAAIEALVPLDMALYDYGVELFESRLRQMDAERAGDSESA